ncbi:MAG: chemotaxis protein CheW [Lautropia sp.]
MDDPPVFVAFSLEGQQFAVPVAAVERVVPAAAIRRLREAPEPLIGLIDLAGVVTPVLDVRTEGPRDREIEVDDRFLVLGDRERRAVVVVDAVEGVVPASPGSVLALDAAARYEGGPAATWQRVDGLVLIHDIDSLLTGAVMRSVRAAMADQP